MIYTSRILCYTYKAKMDNHMKHSNTIERDFIEEISGDLRLFSRQLNAYRFLCPHCQSTGRKDNGKQIAPSGAKGYLYKINNSWNFQCKRSAKCGKGHTFEKFLEIFFPAQHIEYVRLRDQLGTTGYQTNCPSLETLMRKQGMLSSQPQQFQVDRKSSEPWQPESPAAVPIPHSPKRSAPACPPGFKLTIKPPMRSPQQQVGHQSRLNHLMKQRQISR